MSQAASHDTWDHPETMERVSVNYLHRSPYIKFFLKKCLKDMEYQDNDQE